MSMSSGILGDIRKALRFNRWKDMLGFLNTDNENKIKKIKANINTLFLEFINDVANLSNEYTITTCNEYDCTENDCKCDERSDDGGWTWNMETIIDIFYRFVELGVDVNTQNRHGTTALHMLVYGESEDNRLIKDLLDQGANVLLKNKMGKTPYDAAMERVLEYNFNNTRNYFTKMYKDIISLGNPDFQGNAQPLPAEEAAPAPGAQIVVGGAGAAAPVFAFDEEAARVARAADGGGGGGGGQGNGAFPPLPPSPPNSNHNGGGRHRRHSRRRAKGKKRTTRRRRV